MSKVIVYGKSGCPNCYLLTRWLDENRISFEYEDVSRYPESINKLRLQTGNSSLPQWKHEGHWYFGFDLHTLQKLFNKYE